MTLLESLHILEVFNSLQKNKVLGLDGWVMEFFLGFYDLIGLDWVRVVEESRKEGKVLGDFNSSIKNILRMIPHHPSIMIDLYEFVIGFRILYPRP
jgi:hypothetical protein